MKRRHFLALAGAAAAFPRVALAQQAQRKIPRVAVVTAVPIPDLASPAGIAAFNSAPAVNNLLPELARLGFVEGQTVILDRYSSPNTADAEQVARTIVASAPDLIVLAGANATALAVIALTSTIPIVAGSADPVAQGIVKSLAPTRRNLAVVSGTASSDFEAKNLALLAEAVPTGRRAAYIGAGAGGQLDSGQQVYFRTVADTALKLGLSVTAIAARDSGDETAFREALATAQNAKADMVQFARGATIAAGSAILARLTLESRMPAMSNYPAFAEAGGLMSAGIRAGEQYQNVAGYVALVLIGANPGDLPVLQPTLFDVVVNLKTAKAIGLNLPPSVLLQATRVIE